jgi:osmotically-inducible protein OsmY
MSGMKTDLELQEDVDEELSFDPSVDATRIGVAAKDGVVTLTGEVSSYAEKLAAEKAAKRVGGVNGVAQEIEVELPAFHRRSDAEIAAAALNALNWEVTLPKHAITVKVENGWLTLDGHVGWQFLKANAEQAVSNLTGVIGISNLIAVTPHSIATGDVSDKIRQTFERSAQIDANRVIVETQDGTVKLYGSVHSWAEHDDAARAAYSVPGVANVENHTLISV